MFVLFAAHTLIKIVANTVNFSTLVYELNMPKGCVDLILMCLLGETQLIVILTAALLYDEFLGPRISSGGKKARQADPFDIFKQALKSDARR